jgi:small subunit ribosomal protein S19
MREVNDVSFIVSRETIHRTLDTYGNRPIICFSCPEKKMSRSLKKGPYVDERLIAKVERNQRTSNREPIKTWSRDCTIVPEFVGATFLVHNGKNFLRLYVTEDMVGHKLGEFSPTRIFKGHSGGKGKK